MQTTPPALAMSTSWLARRSPSVSAVLDAIRDLGFRRVELAYLAPAMVVGLADELAARGLSVQSLHNPIPWLADAAGADAPVGRLACPDEAERAVHVAQARATIDLARALGARAVVVHLGSMEAPVPQRELFGLLKSGRREEFVALRDCAWTEREARKAPYLRSALASIRELGEHAGEAGVALGVETRDGYHEIPSLAEVEEVLAATAGLPVYYWHDVGHAEKQRHLGLATQEDFLARYGSRLLGVHLHDATLDVDHQAPGRGQVDLAAVARLIPNGALRTLELNAQAPTAEDVRQGIETLRKLGLAPG